MLCGCLPLCELHCKLPVCVLIIEWWFGWLFCVLDAIQFQLDHRIGQVHGKSSEEYEYDQQCEHPGVLHGLRGRGK